MLFVIFCYLIHQSLAACNSTALRADILSHCAGADSSRPCPPPCQTSVQAAAACTPNDEALNSVIQTYSFCKPRAVKCKLVLKKESCTGSCQWCNNKCQAGTVKCQASQGCEDDPSGLLTPYGYNCSSLLQVISRNCKYDLGGLGPSLVGATPGTLCPKSCSGCSLPSGGSSVPVTNNPDASSNRSVTATPETSTAPPSSTCKDDPDGLVASQGFDCTTILELTSNNCDYDLSTVSPLIPKGVTPGHLCPQSCQRCNDTSSNTALPDSVAGNSNQDCDDDPEGLVARQSLTCNDILAFAVNDCDLDLSSLNPDIPQNLTAGKLCPKSCSRCQSVGTTSAGSATSATSATSTNATNASASCVDDPSGMVAKYGFNCASVLSATGNDCQKDLHTVSAQIPSGVTPNLLCPKSCGACTDASGQVAPTPQKTTETYINGHVMSATEKRWLSGLGVSLPPGRYFLRSDGSAGPEGGPAVLNIYTAAQNKVDQAMSSSGFTAWAERTQAGFQNFASRVSNFFRG